MKMRGELPKPGYFKNQNSYFVKTVCSWYCSQVRRTRLKQLSSSSSNNSIEDKVISLVFPSVYTKLCVCVYVSCSVVSNPVDCSLPDSSVHGIFQARILEWVVIPFSSSLYIGLHLPPYSQHQFSSHKLVNKENPFIFVSYTWQKFCLMLSFYLNIEHGQGQTERILNHHQSVSLA